MPAINGKDIMLFLDTDEDLEALAMATSHTLNLTSEDEETSSKDSGTWGDQEVVKLRWSATSDNFVTGIEATDPYGKLVKAWMEKKKLNVVLSIPTNITEGEVPAGGWLPPTTGGGYKGKATIESLNLTATNGQKSTYQLSLKGAGELKPLTATP